MAAVGIIGFPAVEAALNAFYETGTWKCMLLSAAYTPAEDTHDFINDASANEITGANYSAGGITLTPTVAFNTGTNLFTVTFPQTQVASTTITARYAAYYQDTGTPSTSRIAFVNDFGENVTSTNGTFTANQCTMTIDFT
jgi:hypothetical protein